MKQQEKKSTQDKRKIVIIYSLFTAAVIIMFLGLFFSAYSVFNNISFHVLSSEIPGIVFGLLVFYLGLKYYLSVVKFKTEFYQSSAEFSWSNFKKEKKDSVKFSKKNLYILRR